MHMVNVLLQIDITSLSLFLLIFTSTDFNYDSVQQLQQVKHYFIEYQFQWQKYTSILPSDTTTCIEFMTHVVWIPTFVGHMHVSNKNEYNKDAC